MRVSICAAIILAAWNFLLPDRPLFAGAGMKKPMKFFVFFLFGSCVLYMLIPDEYIMYKIGGLIG